MISLPTRLLRCFAVPVLTFGTWCFAKSASQQSSISAPRPDYPDYARAHHLTGSGIVVVTVDLRTGYVESARILKSSGHRILDEAALAAFRRWRFKPGTTPEVRIPFRYIQKGAAAGAPAPTH